MCMKLFLLTVILGFSYFFFNFLLLIHKKVINFDNTFEIALPLGQECLKNETLFWGSKETYTYNRIYKQQAVPSSLDSIISCNLQYYQNFYEKLYNLPNFPLKLSINTIKDKIVNANEIINLLDSKEQNSFLSLYGYAIMNHDTIAFLANTYHTQIEDKNYVLIATIKNQEPYSYLVLGYEVPLTINFLTSQFHISMDTIYTNEFELDELYNCSYGQNKYIIQNNIFVSVKN